MSSSSLQGYTQHYKIPISRSALMDITWCHSLDLLGCRVTYPALLPLFEYSVAGNVFCFFSPNSGSGQTAVVTSRSVSQTVTHSKL